MIMLALFLLLVSFSLGVVQESGEGAPDACFDAYLEETNKASLALVADFERCEDLSRWRQPSGEDEQQAEREAMQQEVAEACAQIRNCVDFADHVDFFDCHAEANRRSSKVFMEVHLNSTRILLELSEQHEAAEKERLQCNLEAQHVYSERMATALEAMWQCLDA